MSEFGTKLQKIMYFWSWKFAFNRSNLLFGNSMNHVTKFVHLNDFRLHEKCCHSFPVFVMNYQMCMCVYVCDPWVSTESTISCCWNKRKKKWINNEYVNFMKDIKQNCTPILRPCAQWIIIMNCEGKLMYLTKCVHRSSAINQYKLHFHFNFMINIDFVAMWNQLSLMFPMTRDIERLLFNIVLSRIHVWKNKNKIGMYKMKRWTTMKNDI